MYILSLVSPNLILMLRPLLLILLVAAPALLRAQDAALADADLDFSRDIIQHYHFHVDVELKTPKGEPVRFHYDHYPLDGPFHGVERLQVQEGTFARRGGIWLRSDDWAATGPEVGPDLNAELNTYQAIPNFIFEKPHNYDASQGKSVWTFIAKTPKNGIDFYTYERSREHPHPGGIYPRFTFMKAPHDTDGKLFCVQATGQLRSGTDRVPFVVDVTYLYPIAPGTKVKILDPVTKQEKTRTVTAQDAGWEVTAQQSTPPVPGAP